VVRGVIRNGEIGAMADVSDETKIVETTSSAEARMVPKGEKKEQKPKDWRWIKSLNK
jgi:hypothetical protein